MPARRFFLIHGFVAVLILLVGIAPLISVVIAGTVANAYGCDLDEGSSHPCIIGGTDHGETLYAMGVLGWFVFFTLPFSFIALLGHAAIATFLWTRR